MNQVDLQSLLDGLIAAWENEVIEFKQAGRDYSTDKIGEYFSALANEANLRNLEKSWLVFGINDKTHIVGSDYRPEPERSATMVLALNRSGCWINNRRICRKKESICRKDLLGKL